MNIDVKQIRLVEALARLGNFARAATELKMTQPGLSRAIQNLEQNLGLKLFDRNTRGVTPTVYGKHILQFGVGLIRDVARIERDLFLLKGKDVGELIIGAGIIPSETVIGKTIGKLINLHPRLHVRIIVERPPSLFAMLNRREIDVMIADTRGIERTNDLVVTPLPHHSICFIGNCEHPLSKEAEVPLMNIFRYPLATPWLPENIFLLLEQITGLDAKAIARFENGLVECNNFKMLIEVVGQSEAVGCGLFTIFSQAVDSGEVVFLPIKDSGLSSHYEMVHLERYSDSPTLEIFRTLLLETV